MSGASPLCQAKSGSLTAHKSFVRQHKTDRGSLRRGTNRPGRQGGVAAAATDGSQPPPVLVSPRTEVLEIVGHGCSLYDWGPQLDGAMGRLIASNPSPTPGPDTFKHGQGEWQVFHAPHIARLSSVLGARFDPITYRLQGSRLVSNVRYSHPLLGSGWLSAAGTLSAQDDQTVEVHFNEFWWDAGSDGLRRELSQDSGSSGDGSSSGGGGGVWQGSGDAVVGGLGRAAFLPGFARFPVVYLDTEGLSVFQFPPLSSNIAVQRVGQ